MPEWVRSMRHHLAMDVGRRWSAEHRGVFAQTFAQNRVWRHGASQIGMTHPKSVSRGADAHPTMSKGVKLTKLSAVALALIAGVATAQEADPNIDVNGDGF